MEFSEKAFARQKFRSSRGKGRGRGRGGHYRAPAHKPSGAELDSNSFRYDDEAEQLDDGVVQPKSQGADLESLLEDADTQFNQAFYRFRAQLQDITEEVPPLGATQPDQLLAIDLERLSASLAALPLHALLGLEPHYLEGLEPAAPRPAPPPPSQRPQQPQVQYIREVVARAAPPQAAAAATHAPPHTLRGTSGITVAAVPGPATVGAVLAHPVPGPIIPQPIGTTGVAPAATAAAAGAAAAAAVDQAAGDHDDDDDPELEALLLGRAPGARPTQAPPIRPGLTPSQPAQPAGVPGVLPPALAAAMSAARGQGGTAPELGPSVAGPSVSATVTAVQAPEPGQAARLHPVVGATLQPGAAGAGGGHAAPVVTTRLAPAMAGAAVPSTTAPASSTAGAVRVALPPARLGVPGSGSAVSQPAAVLPSRPAAPSSAPAKPCVPAAVLPARGQAAPAPAPSAAAAGAGAGAGGSGPGAAGGAAGGIDNELRLLLGLPAGQASTAGPAPGGAAITGPGAVRAALPTVTAQGFPKVATRLPSAVLPSSGQQARASQPPPPQQQQQQRTAKSLDDWLDGL